MKVLGFTDLHIRASTPSGRKDDYPKAILAKFDFIIQTALEHEVDAIVCSGDVGDNREWSNSWATINQFVDIRNKAKHIPLITTVGQHDVEGQNIAIYSKYVLGLLEKTEVVKVLTRGNSIDIPVGDKGITVFGFGFGEPETHDFLKGHALLAHNPSWLNIALVHASVAETAFHTIEAISDQNIRNVDFASFGDIHKGFDPYEFKDGSIAFSAGAVARKKYDERLNIPKVWVGGKNDSGRYLEFIEIPCTSWEESFYLNEDDQKTIEDTALGLKAKIERAKAVQHEDSKTKIKRIGSALGFPSDVVDEVVGRILHD